MAISKDDLLSRFEVVNKTVFIESIDSDVTIKKLSLNQRNEINKLMFGENPSVGANGNFSVNPADYSKAALKAVGFGLVEPKLKPSELSGLADNANDFISEVFDAIQENDEPKKKKPTPIET